MTKKKALKKSDTKHVLVLRTCSKGMTSYGDFRWPTSGVVEAKDWNPNKVCGYGLHGLLWGEGDGSLLDWDTDAKWLVVSVPEGTTVDLDGKVKFPRGEVVFCGDRKGATEYLQARSPGRNIVGATATAGYAGTATAGYAGTATAGVRGTATAGYAGTAIAGYAGTATAGDAGILNLRWWDGKRYRIATFYVGEDGIEPNQPYKVDEKGRPVKVEKKAVSND